MWLAEEFFDLRLEGVLQGVDSVNIDELDKIRDAGEPCGHND